MSGRSSIDSLQQLSPVSDSDAAAAFGAAGREELLAELTDLPFGRSGPRRAPARRRSLVLAVAALALVVIATAATWAIVRSGPAHETTSVQCLIGSSDAVIPSTSGNPAHDCAVDYRREFGSAAPKLLAYDNGLGGVTVIPRGQKPQSGWTRLVSGQDGDLIQLQDSLDDYIRGLNSSCLGAAGATAFAQARLTEFGFTGWTVNLRSPASSSTNGPAPKVIPGNGTKVAPTESETNTRMCVASDIVDPTTQSVTLIPTSVAAGTDTAFQKLAAKLRPVTETCQSLPAAVASVRAAASSLGLTQTRSPNGYDLNTVSDKSMRCASIYETVGGTIFLTVRGPKR